MVHFLFCMLVDVFRIYFYLSFRIKLYVKDLMLIKNIPINQNITIILIMK
jgi:hypothetical protein